MGGDNILILADSDGARLRYGGGKGVRRTNVDTGCQEDEAGRLRRRVSESWRRRRVKRVTTAVAAPVHCGMRKESR